MLVRGEAAPAQECMEAAYGRGRAVVSHTDDPPGVPLLSTARRAEQGPGRGDAREGELSSCW